MPIVLVLAIRSIVQLGVTLAVFTTAEAFIKAGQPLLVALLVKIFKFTEAEALDFLHDFMIDQAIAFGLTVVALRKQMPTIVAERLGFTSKGFSKLGFTTAVKKKIETTIGKAAPTILSSGWGAWSPVMKLMSVITGAFMLTQSIEVFAYRPKFFTNILSFVGLGKISEKILIPPQTTLFSNTEISDFAVALKISEDEMRGLLEAATEAVRSQAKVPTHSNVMKIIREDLLRVGPAVDGTIAVQKPPTVPQIKVFTGIVSQGMLGAPLAFTPRENDLIESVEELRDSAHNNLAPFIVSLPGRVSYELKIVASIVTRDGFRQTGTTQQVISGFKKDGTPKFKMVRNKFAILDIFVMSDKKVRTKLTTIVLGPVDSAKLQPQQGDLSALETNLRTDIFTSNIKEIETLVTADPVEIVAPVETPPTQPEVLPAPSDIIYVANGGYAFLLANLAEGKSGTVDNIQVRKTGGRLFVVSTGALVLPESARASAPVTVPVVTPAPLPAVRPGASAVTLFEWYQARGQPLPSVRERSLIYAMFGLGPWFYYTGTAEQNVKLLAKLQGKS